MHLILLKKVQASFSVINEELIFITHVFFCSFFHEYSVTKIFTGVEWGCCRIAQHFSNDHFVICTPHNNLSLDILVASSHSPTNTSSCTFPFALLAFCSLHSFYVFRNLFFRETLVFSTTLCMSMYLKFFVCVTDKKQNKKH